MEGRSKANLLCRFACRPFLRSASDWAKPMRQEVLLWLTCDSSTLADILSRNAAATICVAADPRLEKPTGVPGSKAGRFLLRKWFEVGIPDGGEDVRHVTETYLRPHIPAAGRDAVRRSEARTPWHSSRT